MAYTLFSTTFGTCAVSWNEAGITRFQLPCETDEAAERRLGATVGARIPEAEAPPWVRDVMRRVRLHVGGVMQDFSDVVLDASLASDFQHAVYRQALLIRPGFKKSYGEVSVALGLGLPGARAVGVALATNPWPLLVPCHRVVAADGRMTGFSAPGGVLTKTRLLFIEGAELLSE
jgi:methylated-DNA-[protein]-cysteine S-methyltransferase